MTKKELLKNLQELLELEEPLKLDMALEEIEDWDSLAALSVSAFFDEHFSKPIEANEFESLKFVSDLVAIVETKLED